MTPITTAPWWRGVRPMTRHSLVLIVAGAVYIITGLVYILTQPTASREASLELARRWLSWLPCEPLAGWGAVFILVGIAAVISSRWPPPTETWGYYAMTGLAAGWSGFYVAGVVFMDAPAGGLSGALLWGLVAFLWWAISGLVNPTRKGVARVRP